MLPSPPTEFQLALRALLREDDVAALSAARALEPNDYEQIHTTVDRLCTFLSSQGEAGFAARLWRALERLKFALPQATLDDLPRSPILAQLHDVKPVQTTADAASPDRVRRQREGMRALEARTSDPSALGRPEAPPVPPLPLASRQLLPANEIESSPAKVLPKASVTPRALPLPTQLTHRLGQPGQTSGELSASSSPQLVTIRRRPVPAALQVSWIARNALKTRIDTELRNYGWVALWGTLGVGKSVIAQQLEHAIDADPERYPGGVLYCDLGGMPGDGNAELIISQWLRLLDISIPAYNISTARNALANAGPFVIILDNAQPKDEALIREVTRVLPRSSQILLTTRHRPLASGLGLRQIEVEGLTYSEAVDFFRRRCNLPGDAEPIWITNLWNSSAGHPTLLEVAAQRLLAHPHSEWHYIAVKFAERLTAGKEFLDPTSTQLPVMDSLERELYHSYDALSPRQQADFRYLGVVAAGKPFPARLASTLWGCNETSARDRLDLLTAEALVRRNEQEPLWELTPVMHYMAWQLLHSDLTERKEALTRCVAFHEQALSRHETLLAHLSRVIDLCIEDMPEAALQLIAQCSHQLMGDEMRWWLYGQAEQILAHIVGGTTKLDPLPIALMLARLLPHLNSNLTGVWQPRLERTRALLSQLLARPAIDEARIRAVRALLTHRLLAFRETWARLELLPESIDDTQQAINSLTDGDELYTDLWVALALLQWQYIQRAQVSASDLVRLRNACSQAIQRQRQDNPLVLILSTVRTTAMLVELGSVDLSDTDATIVLLRVEIEDLRRARAYAPTTTDPDIDVLALLVLARCLLLQGFLDTANTSVIFAETVQVCQELTRRVAETASLENADVLLGWAGLLEVLAKIGLAAINEYSTAVWKKAILEQLNHVINIMPSWRSREGVVLARRLRRQLLLELSDEASSPIPEFLLQASEDARVALLLIDPILEPEVYAEMLDARMTIIGRLADLELPDKGLWLREAIRAVDDVLRYMTQIEDADSEASSMLIGLLSIRATLLLQAADSTFAGAAEILVDARTTARAALDRLQSQDEEQLVRHLLTVCVAAGCLLALSINTDRASHLRTAFSDTWELYQFATDRNETQLVDELRETLQALRGPLSRSFMEVWATLGYGPPPAWLAEVTTAGCEMSFATDCVILLELFLQARMSGALEDWKRVHTAARGLTTYLDEPLLASKAADVRQTIQRLQIQSTVSLATALLRNGDAAGFEQRMSEAAIFASPQENPISLVNIRYTRALALAYVAPQPVGNQIREALQDALLRVDAVQPYVEYDPETKVELQWLEAEMIGQLVNYDADSARLIPRILRLEGALATSSAAAPSLQTSIAEYIRAKLYYLMAGLPNQPVREHLQMVVSICSDAIVNANDTLHSLRMRLLSSIANYDLALELEEDPDILIGVSLREVWSIWKAAEIKYNELELECRFFLIMLRIEYDARFSVLWSTTTDSLCPPWLLSPTAEQYSNILDQSYGRFFQFNLRASIGAAAVNALWRAAQAAERLLPWLALFDAHDADELISSIQSVYERLGRVCEAEERLDVALQAYERAQQIGAPQSELAAAEQRVRRQISQGYSLPSAEQS